MDMMTKKEIAKMFGMSTRTVQTKVGKMEALTKRYPKYAIARSGHKLYINAVAFFDYLTNEESLSNKRLAKYVEPFDYDEARKYLKGVNDEFVGSNESQNSG